MAYERPAWADQLRNVLKGIADDSPKPLLALLAIHASPSAHITPTGLAEYLEQADENDPTLTQLRLALANWDGADGLHLTAEDGSDTRPHSVARRRTIYRALHLDGAPVDVLDRRVPVFEKPAIVIAKNFEPWYAEAQKQRSSVYWDDYQRYLLETKNWDPEAIATLHQTSTDVVQRLSDPTRPEIRQTKGLVVGYVQSGKTANFTGVVAKAIDAGYRLIVVLTGTIEILREQTQRRIDMELVGVENILAGLDPEDPEVAKELDYQQDGDWHAGRFVKHGNALDQSGVVAISRVTTHHSDYKRLPQGLTRLKFQRTDKKKPLNDPVNLFNSDAYVAIVKKNSAPLKKLIKDLNPLKDQLLELPVLIIDDESDQASVDTTNPERWKKKAGAAGKPTAEERERTRINGLITDILAICPRAQYVGYTATPFANVFVDPDDDRDLFPADFVLSLRRPPGYMGVREFHDVDKDWDDEEKTEATSNELAHVRALKGDPDSNPVAREMELQEALDAWVLSGAIKLFRQSHSQTTFRHHTMLVHESVGTGEHSATAEAVRDVWRISRFNSATGLKRLRKLYESDFLPVMQARAAGQAVPSSFDELTEYVVKAVAKMNADQDPVMVVNSDKAVQDQQKKLDFDTDQVWRILVGGTKLSRGFTVEGLTISYFRRKAGQADTLMQAGRWFGFRPGYQDLVRLYIRRDEKVDLYAAFEALLMDEEAFREELRQYEGLDENGMPIVEPRQIPPLVSQHLPWLRPTARNKMWNAVIEEKATAGGFQDRYGIPERGSADNKHNLATVAVPLLQSSTQMVTLAPGVDAKIGVVSAGEFLELFAAMHWHPDYGDEVVGPLERFITTATQDGRIAEWAVVWPQPTKGGEVCSIPGLGTVPVVKRSRRPDRIDFVGSDRKHTNAALPIAKGENVPGLPGRAGRGVALVYLADDRPDAGKELSKENVVPLLSIAVPISATPHRRDLIRWTVRSKVHEGDAAIEKEDVEVAAN